MRHSEVPVQRGRPNYNLIPCIGCGALVPGTAGPTNANLGVSPGCWAVYETVRARGTDDPRYAEFRQLTIDAYAVQHPAESKQGSIQAVVPHLIGLCALLEKDLPASLAIGAVHNAVKIRDSFEGLRWPESCGDLTILHVRDATTLQDHVRRVRDWSSWVWKAWSPHHRVLRKWTEEMLRRSQQGRRPAPWFFPTRRP